MVTASQFKPCFTTVRQILDQSLQQSLTAFPVTHGLMAFREANYGLDFPPIVMKREIEVISSALKILQDKRLIACMTIGHSRIRKNLEDVLERDKCTAMVTSRSQCQAGRHHRLEIRASNPFIGRRSNN